MSFPIITAWLAVFLTALLIYLILKIVNIRWADRIELETGGNDRLRRAVRSHGNLVETAPLFIIILSMLEVIGANELVVVILALMFAISRITHPIGLSGIKGTFLFRTFGMVLTLIAYIVAALYLAYLLFLFT